LLFFGPPLGFVWASFGLRLGILWAFCGRPFLS
jgi:hypothetical protein